MTQAELKDPCCACHPFSQGIVTPLPCLLAWVMPFAGGRGEEG